MKNPLEEVPSLTNDPALQHALRLVTTIDEQARKGWIPEGTAELRSLVYAMVGWIDGARRRLPRPAQADHAPEPEPFELSVYDETEVLTRPYPPKSVEGKPYNPTSGPSA